MIDEDSSSGGASNQAVFHVAGAGSSHQSFMIKAFYRGRAPRKVTESTLKRSLKLQIACDGWYEGAFELQGKRYRAVLRDMNGNGSFNDPVVPPDPARMQGDSKVSLRGDLFGLLVEDEIPLRKNQVGGDHFGMTSDTKVDAGSFQICGDLLVIGNETFEVKLKPSKEVLELAPIEEGLVPLRLPEGMKRMSLFNADGSHCVMIYHPGDGVRIPPGTWRVSDYCALRKDGEGDLWSLTASATGASPLLILEEGKGAKAPFGAPYAPRAEIPEWSLKNVKRGLKKANLEFVISGRGKELVTDLLRVSGERTSIPLSSDEKNRPMEATYRVVGEDGTVVLQGRFKYG
jgi:hypothetical protein